MSETNYSAHSANCRPDIPSRDDRRGDALGSEHVAEGVGGVVADVNLVDEVGGHGDCGW